MGLRQNRRNRLRIPSRRSLGRFRDTGRSRPSLSHIRSGTEDDWGARYAAIRHEMDSYGGGLLTKPEIVVINKIDAISDEALAEKMAAFKKSFGRKKKPQILTISAAGRTGVETLISAIEKLFQRVENAGTNI